jgi:hypothetical protein
MLNMKYTEQGAGVTLNTYVCIQDIVTYVLHVSVTTFSGIEETRAQCLKHE